MRRKVFVFSFFTAVLVSSLFFSCNQDKRSLFKADNGVEFDTINIEKKYFLDDNPENPSCNLKLTFVYPESIANFDARAARSVFLRTVIGPNYDSLSAKEAVDRYIRNYIGNYRNDAGIYQINKPLQEHVGNRSDGPYVADEELDYLPEVFYSYYETLSDSIVYNQYGIISFQVRQVNNKGGRMSYETVRNYVLDLSSGELMTEGEIFSAGYDLALRPILQNSLLEANGVKSIQELEDLGFFGIDEIVPNKNFLITDKGITYTFNKGEYSAYQLQVPQVFIPYAAVRSLLRENSVVSKLTRLK
jgi:hypothetical protein